jgi:hypothetical protein
MRIAFAGASGTGKTTLAEWVSEEFDLPMNPVGSRTVAKAMGFSNPYDVDAMPGKRAEFQQRLVTDKREWEDEHPSFVTDRTTLDNLAYTMLHDVYAVDESLLNTIRGGLERYTHIVFFPISSFFTLSGDKNRVGGGKYGSAGDNTYHRLYEIVLYACIEKWRPPNTKLIILHQGGMKARHRAMRELMDPAPPIPHLPG